MGRRGHSKRDVTKDFFYLLIYLLNLFIVILKVNFFIFNMNKIYIDCKNSKLKACGTLP